MNEQYKYYLQKGKLTGDFSFKDNWSYPEGVYWNEFGQLSCEGKTSEKWELQRSYLFKLFGYGFVPLGQHEIILQQEKEGGRSVYYTSKFMGQTEKK